LLKTNFITTNNSATVDHLIEIDSINDLNEINAKTDLIVAGDENRR